MFETIRNIEGEKIDYTFHAGEKGTKVMVVLGHGVTGNKDRPFVVALAEALSHDGIPALRMSFSGNGDSEGRFEDSTISKEVNDLGSVFDVLDGWNILYVGHSMGGAVGVLLASQDPRIVGLVSLAGMVHTDAFSQREFSDVTPDKGLMWDEPACPLSQVFIDDTSAIGTVVTRAPSIKVPWLLVHGTADDVVPLQDSLDIFERANDPKQLVQIEGADHVFSTHTPKMVKVVHEWVRGQIGRT
ncbi:alpha/beta hydrolase [Candidatus Nitrospira salsa]